MLEVAAHLNRIGTPLRVAMPEASFSRKPNSLPRRARRQILALSRPEWRMMPFISRRRMPARMGRCGTVPAPHLPLRWDLRRNGACACHRQAPQSPSATSSSTAREAFGRGFFLACPASPPVSPRRGISACITNEFPASIHPRARATPYVRVRSVGQESSLGSQSEPFSRRRNEARVLRDP